MVHSQSQISLEIQYDSGYSTNNLSQFGSDVCQANFGTQAALISIAGLTDGSYFETFNFNKRCTRLEPCKYRIQCQNTAVALNPDYLPLSKPGSNVELKLEYQDGFPRTDLMAFGNEICQANFGRSSNASNVSVKNNGDEP